MASAGSPSRADEVSEPELESARQSGSARVPTPARRPRQRRRAPRGLDPLRDDGRLIGSGAAGPRAADAPPAAPADGRSLVGRPPPDESEEQTREPDEQHAVDRRLDNRSPSERMDSVWNIGPRPRLKADPPPPRPRRGLALAGTSGPFRRIPAQPAPSTRGDRAYDARPQARRGRSTTSPLSSDPPVRTRRKRNQHIRTQMRTVVSAAARPSAMPRRPPRLRRRRALIRRAATKGVIPKKRADRSVGRLAKRLNAVGSA